MTLENNQRIELVIKKTSGIAATDGAIPSSNIKLIFYSQADPMYSTVEYLQLEGGELIESLPGAALYLQLYAASTLIDDILLFDPNIKLSPNSEAWKFFRRARMEFVTCKAMSDLIKAIISSKGTSAGRRTLADFTIDLGSQANLLSQAKNYLTDVVDCYTYWRKVLFSAGQADFMNLKPLSGVKSGTNPYEHVVGRGWVVGGPTLNSREESKIQNGTKNRPRRIFSPI